MYAKSVSVFDLSPMSSINSLSTPTRLMIRSYSVVVLWLFMVARTRQQNSSKFTRLQEYPLHKNSFRSAAIAQVLPTPMPPYKKMSLSASRICFTSLTFLKLAGKYASPTQAKKVLAILRGVNSCIRTNRSEHGRHNAPFTFFGLIPQFSHLSDKRLSRSCPIDSTSGCFEFSFTCFSCLSFISKRTPCNNFLFPIQDLVSL